MFDSQRILHHIPSGERSIIHPDDFEYFLEDREWKREDTELLTVDQAKPDEIAEMVSNGFEDENYHSLTGAPHSFLKEMQEDGSFTEEQQIKVLKMIAGMM